MSLLRRVRSQEDGAFERLVRLYSPLIYAYRPFYQFGFQEPGVQENNWQQFPSGQITSINLQGTKGNDVFLFRNYGTNIFAGLSDVAIETSDGDDKVGIYVGGGYTAVADMGADNDSLALSGAEFVQASLGIGNDSLSTSGRGDIDAGPGNDGVTVGYGIVVGGDGDKIQAGLGNDIVVSGGGDDSVNGSQYTVAAADLDKADRDLLLLSGIKVDGVTSFQIEQIFFDPRGVSFAVENVNCILDDNTLQFLDNNQLTEFPLANGGHDRDVIFGSSSTDVLLGGAGSDYVAGEQGNDYAYGQAGIDVVNGDGYDLTPASKTALAKGNDQNGKA
jgi:hypothetical protein